MKTPREMLDELAAWTRLRSGRQTKVAAVIGLRRQQINDYLTNRSVPTWANGRKIEAFLRLSEERRRKAIGEEYHESET